MLFYDLSVISYLLNYLLNSADRARVPGRFS
jgi:hypothetical protein